MYFVMNDGMQFMVVNYLFQFVTNNYFKFCISINVCLKWELGLFFQFKTIRLCKTRFFLSDFSFTKHLEKGEGINYLTYNTSYNQPCYFGLVKAYGVTTLVGIVRRTKYGYLVREVFLVQNT